jgi:2-polyprenyl-3-methyl-5-hydroxy-6-metoxy-1,4-benzoquinol methylase
MCKDHENVRRSERFCFGSNWAKFLRHVNEYRISLAMNSLLQMLEVDNLNGKRFLDIGSGSGLFSLAARRLGAVVHSFDFDLQSVECTKELRSRFLFPDDQNWRIEAGSVLDKDYLARLGKFDVVYSWGVLHHTGVLGEAMENIVSLVNDDGKLFISIYNDQGRASRLWLRIKSLYNLFPKGLRWLILFPVFMRLWGPTTMRDIMHGRPFHTWRNYAENGARGMNPWRDVVDWAGGLPFEVRKPEEVFDFYSSRGFRLCRLTTCGGGHGCNEFVFKRLV